MFGDRPDLERPLLTDYLRPGMPPLLLQHGAWNTIVEPGQPEHLPAAAIAAGGRAEVRVHPRIGHLDSLKAAPWVPSRAPVADDIAGLIAYREATRA